MPTLVLLAAEVLEVVAITVLCATALVSAIVVSVKGRSRAWCIPCILFPPFLYVLFRLRPSERAGQFQCPFCEQWNPAERERCRRCGEIVDLGDFVE